MARADHQCVHYEWLDVGTYLRAISQAMAPVARPGRDGTVRRMMDGRGPANIVIIIISNTLPSLSLLSSTTLEKSL